MNRQLAGWITHRWVKWVVLVVVLLIAAGFGSFGTKLSSVEKNDVAAWLPDSAESTAVLKKSAAFSDPDATPFIVVYTRDSAVTPADLAKVAADAKKLATVKHVDDQVVGPIPAKDGKALELIGTLVLPSDGWTTLPDRLDDIKKIATSGADGMTVHIGGPAAFGADQATAFGGIDTTLLFSAVGVVIVLLLLTYRSPVLWLVPLFAGLVSVFSAQGVVYLLAKHAGLTVNSQSAAILSVLVLGAGIDYALLLVARYREELHRFEDRHEAMAHALHRAAPAILASGSTVMIGLLCLLLAQMNSTAGLGPVGAAGIAIALVVMLVLLPALLVIFGRWVFWPFIPRYGSPERSETGMWAKVGRGIARAPRLVWVVTSLVLLVCTLGGLQLNATGLSNADSFTKTQPSVTAEKVIAEHFPAGAGSPLQVIANADHATGVVTALRSVTNVSSVSSPVVKGDLAYIEATMSVAADSDAAKTVVERARHAAHDVAGADAKVGGQTALTLDVQNASSADNRLIIPIILLVVVGVLALLLRAVAAPLILLATVLLSFFAAVGISALIFRHVFGWAGADPSFLLYCFVFLVALGIDYNIFLMTRVREETLAGHGTRRASLVALAATGGVITSAGLVLAGTFSTLAVLPIVVIAEIGFTVALGVLLDTIIVRSVLVTAINLDVGRIIWWPSRLWRTDGGAETDRH